MYCFFLSIQKRRSRARGGQATELVGDPNKRLLRAGDEVKRIISVQNKTPTQGEGSDYTNAQTQAQHKINSPIRACDTASLGAV